MKVVFVCGSLEAGQDGVGDYTAKIAFKLMESVHEVFILAINDRYIDKETAEFLETGNGRIQVLRIPSSLNWAQKHAIAGNFINCIRPDWISLQYVPYSFDPKGIPMGFFRKLKQTFGGARCHVMFHEIWQGESVESSLKDKLIGFLQKTLTILMLRSLKLRWVTTSNQFYANSIAKQGMKADILPVFSNLPIADGISSGLMDRLPEEIKTSRESFLIGVFFGGLHAHQGLASNLLILRDLVSRDLNKELVVVHVGKSANIEAEMLKLSDTTGIRAFALGIAEARDISNFFAIADIGLSNYPKVLFEKSGSVAAMLFNSLPVIFLKESFEPDARSFPEVSELRDIKEMKKFTGQDRLFYAKYGIQFSLDAYLKKFTFKD